MTGGLLAFALIAVFVEAATIGFAASLVGLVVGVLAAGAIRALLSSFGFTLPSTALMFKPRTAAVGLGVGTLVTIVAGLVPALRATRVTPLEALRESDAPSAPTRRVWLIALPAAALAAAGLPLIFASSGSTSARLTQSAAGAVALVFAIVARRCAGGGATGAAGRPDRRAIGDRP